MKNRSVNIILFFAAFFLVNSLVAQSPRNIELTGSDKEEQTDEDRTDDRVYKRKANPEQREASRKGTRTRSNPDRPTRDDQARSSSTCDQSWQDSDNETKASRPNNGGKNKKYGAYAKGQKKRPGQSAKRNKQSYKTTGKSQARSSRTCDNGNNKKYGAYAKGQKKSPKHSTPRNQKTCQTAAKGSKEQMKQHKGKPHPIFERRWDARNGKGN